jgi:nitrogen-specific signal transduction histidine kinase
LVQRAITHLSLLEENRTLRQSRQPVPPAARPPRRDESLGGPASLFHFSRAFRHFDKLESMLEHLIEGVANCSRVARIGVFVADRDGGTYRLRAGLKCLEGTNEIEFADDDPLLCWMRMNPHLVSRSGLEHIADASEAAFLRQILDTLGAEAIVPLYTEGRITGWMFFGRHVTGLPFSETVFEELVTLSEHVSVILENGVLYDEISVQKTLAETLLHAMPSGIVAVDNRGIIRWFNEGAAKILEQGIDDVRGQPAGAIGSRLGDLLIQCLRGRETERKEWVDPNTRLSLALQTRRLGDSEKCLGAVLIIQDMTQEQRMREKQERIERAAFWTELAAAISHEVRNPLVAISTFAQLLPERYDDPEFRDKFSNLARDEINRVNHLLNQLDSFANQPELSFKPMDISKVLDKALDAARARIPFNGTTVNLEADPSLPTIEADEASLVDCFAHLITNSVEATADSPDAAVTVSATATGGDNGNRMVRISVSDTGKGIPLYFS